MLPFAMYGPFSLVTSSCFRATRAGFHCEFAEGSVQPLHKDAFDVAAIPVNCRFAATFSNKMSIQIPLPGLLERHVYLSARLARYVVGRSDMPAAVARLWVLSFANLSQVLLS